MSDTPPAARRSALFQSRIPSLELVHRGKVRDVYAVDDKHLLIVVSDRLSAFDVVLPDPIPGKGQVLTRISNFWFERTAHIVRNHLTGIDPDAVVRPEEAAQLKDRAIVVKRLKPLPIEAVIRGYIIGSGWKDYLASGAVCGIELPPGLAQAAPLAQPLFTPATKAAVGDHDENISFEQAANIVGTEVAEAVRECTLNIYQHAVEYAATRGIIIADTKFEFAVDENGELVLVDEILTPDSSRFWPADEYREGISPPSFDKQFVRDYLETLDWDKTAPGPAIPQEVIEKSMARYLEAQARLTGILD